ncbi:MAG TPA: helix-turn-helix domain-containing protein [Candidatus Brevibacterium intestinavium]|nr:helix-turn-helix domain-containing protein [Candidatus Brevibacterium intestinavium]
METQKRPHTGRGDRRAEILRALRAETTATAAELAEALGIHPNTVRFHLGVLESNGDVIREQVPARRPGRPELRFRIVARPSAARPDLLARILLERVASAADPDSEAEDAGRQWGTGEGTGAGGAGDAAVDGLIDTLESTGFAPVRTEDDVIDLHSCPLREFLSTHGHLVCSIHRGLMAGYLDAAQSPSTVDSLEPFSTASSCRTRLRRRTNADKP